MSPDELADEMLCQSRDEISALTVKKNLLYGYVAAMRQVPAYLSFSQRNPDFGDAELARKIVIELRRLIITDEVPLELGGLIDLLDKEYVPNTEDFGLESAALEGALALIYLYTYSHTKEPKNVLEIVRGIIECILMWDDTSEVMQALSIEQSIRRRQFELIKSAEDVSDDLLDRCLAMNEIDV